MSIIYKGLNPKNHYGLCILTIDGELITANGKHFQAIQIPKNHGRLIDADEMQDKAYKRYFNNTISSYGMFEVNRAIDNAPTILEAEE